MPPTPAPVPRTLASGPRTLAIVPVKSLDLAKSRLALPGRLRRELALGFAADTLAALSGCPDILEILVVTSDPAVAELAEAMGARLLPDEGGTIDDAVVAAASTARPRLGGAGVLVLPADLPCLRPGDVTAVLHQAGRYPCAFVPDLAGSGTTMVLHAPGQQVRTAYGPGSAARHTALGLVALQEAPARARHDVDTLEDLRAAVARGLGPQTAALLAASVSAGHG